ncbi:MAG: hypothetical protein ACYTGW_20720, partial [Planctomycetota bacterium]
MKPKLVLGLSFFGLVTLTLASPAPAQVAAGDVLVAHTATSSSDGLTVVTLTGKATRITGHSNGTHVTVALDPHDPRSVWGSGSGPTVGKLSPVNHYRLQGTVASKGSGDGTVGLGNFGKVVRMHVYGNDTLLTLSGTNAGLYRRPLKGGNALLNWKIPDAFDIAVMKDKAYVTTVSTASPKAPSKLFEVDLLAVPIKVREIKLTVSPTSTTPAPRFFGAIASAAAETFSALLWVMDDKGGLHAVDPNSTTGFNTVPFPGGLSTPIVAVAVHPNSKIGYIFATKRKLYDFNNFFLGTLGTPFYTSSTDIQDIAVDAGGLTLYGQACPGQKGLPRWGFGGYPFQGNAAHQLVMQNGPAGAQYRLVIGLVGVKQSLAPIGANNCFLHLPIMIELGGNLDSKGVVKVPAPIPVQASLMGATAYAQFGIADSTANAVGLITSRGLKLT